MGSGDSSWIEAYERRMRRFDLEVILAALIVMILTAELFIAWGAFQNSMPLPHSGLSVHGIEKI
jgi:hypothetical protein